MVHLLHHPRTRGPLRSYPEEQILDDVRRQVGRGVREVVLTGVHLGKYGDDRGERDALARLVDRLTAIDGLLRLRLSSVLPVQVTPALVARVRDDPKVCRHLHVPLQAGDDEVLAAMHRPYRIAEFLDRVEEAKAEIPGLGLSTDVIVGFPGRPASSSPPPWPWSSGSASPSCTCSATPSGPTPRPRPWPARSTTPRRRRGPAS